MIPGGRRQADFSVRHLRFKQPGKFLIVVQNFPSYHGFMMRDVSGAGKHLQQPLCVCGWASILVFGQAEGQSVIWFQIFYFFFVELTSGQDGTLYTFTGPLFFCLNSLASWLLPIWPSWMWSREGESVFGYLQIGEIVSKYEKCHPRFNMRAG